MADLFDGMEVDWGANAPPNLAAARRLAGKVEAALHDTEHTWPDKVEAARREALRQNAWSIARLMWWWVESLPDEGYQADIYVERRVKGWLERKEREAMNWGRPT